MQPYMLEEFPPEISRLQPLFFSSDFGDQSKYLLSLYRSFYLCLRIAHDVITLRPYLPYPVHDELPALSPKKYNITFLKLSVRLFEIYHIPCMDQKRCHTASKDQHADFFSFFRQFLKHTYVFSCIYNLHIPHPAFLYLCFVRSVLSANPGTILSTVSALFFINTLNSTQILFYHTIAVFFLQHQNITLIFNIFRQILVLFSRFFCLVEPNSYISLLIYSICRPFISSFYLFTLNLCYIIVTY